MSKKIKKRGFTLIEVVVACMIILCSSTTFVSMVSGNFKILKVQDILEKEKTVIDIVKNEIKFNTSLCELNKYFDENTNLYLKLDGLNDKLVANTIFQIGSTTSNGDRSIKIFREYNDGEEIRLVFQIVKGDEVEFANSINKKTWMENI